MEQSSFTDVLHSRKFWALVIALLAIVAGYATGQVDAWQAIQAAVAALAAYSTGVAIEDAGYKAGAPQRAAATTAAAVDAAVAQACPPDPVGADLRVRPDLDALPAPSHIIPPLDDPIDIRGKSLTYQPPREDFGPAKSPPAREDEYKTGLSDHG